jgi:hypothetical protein
MLFTHLRQKDAPNNNSRTIERYPVIYEPRSTTQINHSRLPPLEELRTMELAFRQEPHDERKLSRWAQAMILLFCCALPLLINFGFFIGALIPFLYSFSLAVLLGVLAGLAFLFFPKQRGIKPILYSLVLPPAFVIASKLLVWFFGGQAPVIRRQNFVFLFGAVVFGLLFLRGHELRPLQFLREWIYTHPRLTHEERLRRNESPLRIALIIGCALACLLAFVLWFLDLLPFWAAVLIFTGPILIGLRREMKSTYPSLVLFIGFLFLLSHVMAYSQGLVFALCLLAGLTALSLGAWRRARIGLGHFLFYGYEALGAPGTWMSGATCQKRRKEIIIALSSFYLLCTVGMLCYVPIDAALGYFRYARLVEDPLSHYSDMEKPTKIQQREYDRYLKEHPSLLPSPTAPSSRKPKPTPTPAPVKFSSRAYALRVTLRESYTPEGICESDARLRARTTSSGNEWLSVFRTSLNDWSKSATSTLDRYYSIVAPLPYVTIEDTPLSSITAPLDDALTPGPKKKPRPAPTVSLPPGLFPGGAAPQILDAPAQGPVKNPGAGYDPQPYEFPPDMPRPNQIPTSATSTAQIPSILSPITIPFPKLHWSKDEALRFIVMMLIQFSLCILVPNAVLLALFHHPLHQLEKLRAEIDGNKKSPLWELIIKLFEFLPENLHALIIGRLPKPKIRPLIDDNRSEWQWHCDRLRFSRHIIIDPYGNKIEEAPHVWLGFEPSLQIPVIVDRKILSEHVYIAGQTGSGKTALAIMPILIQLIRGYKLNTEAEIQKGRKEERKTSPAMTEEQRKAFHHFITEAHGMLQGLQTSQSEEANVLCAKEFFAQFTGGYREMLQSTCDEASSAAYEAIISWVETQKDLWLRSASSREALQNALASTEAKLQPPSRSKEPQGERPDSDPVPIVIIDLKGDLALFHTVREEAKARGQEFRFFTPEKGKPTYYFNPFSGFASESRTFIQLCHLFLDSLSMNYGDGYGKSYFSKRSRQLLYDALIHPSKPQTFPEVLSVMQEMMKDPDYKDAYEILSTVQALAQYPQLVTTTEQEEEAPETTINMRDVLEHNQIVYFWLPSAIESITAKEIGKLALFSMLSGAIDRQHENKPYRQAYLVIDEFQRLMGENFKIILEQARGFGVSAILANQTLADLRTQETDLRPTILTNTRLRIFFSVNDPDEIATLSMLSGEEVRITRSWSSADNLTKLFIRQSSQTETETEGFKNRFTTSEILAISDHPHEMIVTVSRGSGYSQFGGQPLRVRTSYPLHTELYKERSALPWPTLDEFKQGDLYENEQSPQELEEEARKLLLDEHQRQLKEAFG